MRLILGGILLITACGLSYGQSDPAKPEFEVASIKPSPPRVPNMPMRVGSDGGPGSKDPTRWNCENCSLNNLIFLAYGISSYELTAPDWGNGTMFMVEARVPEGTTRDQFKLMLQNLLADRFKLAFHREKKELPVYELVVAKPGKLKESVEQPPPADGAAPVAPPGFGPPKLGADGFPVLPPNRNGTIMMNGQARMNQLKTTMVGFSRFLAGQMRGPVTDGTGLTGKYDISLYWAQEGFRGPTAPAGSAEPVASEPNSGPTLQQALLDQLGLKLVSKKGQVEMFVVDHAEKMPTEN